MLLTQQIWSYQMNFKSKQINKNHSTTTLCSASVLDLFWCRHISLSFVCVIILCLKSLMLLYHFEERVQIPRHNNDFFFFKDSLQLRQSFSFQLLGIHSLMTGRPRMLCHMTSFVYYILYEVHANPPLLSPYSPLFPRHLNTILVTAFFMLLCMLGHLLY